MNSLFHFYTEQRLCLKRLFPAWTTSGNTRYISTDTYQAACVLKDYYITNVVFILPVLVCEEISIFFVLVAMKKH